MKHSEISAKKQLGQHFLVDTNIIDQIISAFDAKEHENIIEIGPGTGAISFALIDAGIKFLAIEKDSRAVKFLEKKNTNKFLKIINNDVLNLNFIDHMKSPLRIIGNLPYNITSPILFHCLAQREYISDMLFMVQKEVAERLNASINTKDYGRLTIMLQQFFDTEYLFTVYPESFNPPPKVDSAIIRLKTLKNSRWQIQNQNIFEQIVQTSFSQRRKMIRKSLANFITEQELKQLGIEPENRPENLSGENFATIANHINNTNAKLLDMDYFKASKKMKI